MTEGENSSWPSEAARAEWCGGKMEAWLLLTSPRFTLSSVLITWKGLTISVFSFGREEDSYFSISKWESHT